MSKLITAKSPVFWIVVFAGVVLPALTLHGVAQAVVTLLVVAFIVVGLLRARRRQRASAAE
ncbi:hypothetical protein [Cryptosporangium japonicum]|uniref:Uncharacterized protein n=1 Tax=Cryptosporangium japonicum TaxID=80872 RepID=A0ABN0TIE7_9ACTN